MEQGSFSENLQRGSTIGHDFALIMYTVLPVEYKMMFVLLDVIISSLYGTFIDITKALSTIMDSILCYLFIKYHIVSCKCCNLKIYLFFRGWCKEIEIDTLSRLHLL